MFRRVVAEQDQHFRIDDVTNLNLFPQQGAEQTTKDWLGTLRYRGLTVVKDNSNQVTVAVGAAYIDYRQFALTAPWQVTLTDEKPLIAGQKRVVILSAQGSPDIPAPAVTRDKTVEVPDGNGGSVVQDTTQSTAPYVENKVLVAKIAGGLSTQEVEPSVPANVVPFCRIVLDLNGIVGDPVMLTSHRINSVSELDAMINQQGRRIDNMWDEVLALRSDLVGLQGWLRSTVSHETIGQLIYDVATLKDMQDIDDAGAPYAIDRFERASESATGHPDFKGRVTDQGFQLPYANENRSALALYNVNDPRYMHANAGVLFPAYDPVVGFAVHSSGDTMPLGGTVTQSLELVQMTRTRVRVRYGGYFHYHYLNVAAYHPLRGTTDVVHQVFCKHNEVLAYPVGFFATAYLLWASIFRPRVIVDTYQEPYDVWQKTDVTMNGVIKAQSWLQSQERYVPALRLGITAWEAGSEVTIAACEFGEDGMPDPKKVLATKTLTAAAFQKYVPGDVSTMTRFAFAVPIFNKRARFGYITSVTGQVTIGKASGDRFTGGNSFESTDGNLFVASILNDHAFAVEYCNFRMTSFEARLANLNLDGGIQNVDIVAPATVPDNCSAKFRTFSSGAWKEVAQVPEDPAAVATETDEVFGNGLTATYDFQVLLSGNEWVMPVLDLGNSEVTVFRSDDDWHHVGIVRDVPAGPTWVRVRARARIAGYDAVRHTLDAWIQHGATLATQKLKDGAPTVTPVPGNNAVDVEWTFTVDPDGNKYQLHITGATNNIAFPLTMLQIYSTVED
jgi:hypothetical protein